MNPQLSFLRDMLVLSSVQSAGATIGIPLVAYFMSGAEVSQTMWLLVVSLALLHMGVFSHNDIADLDKDREAGRTQKPLASWRIGITTAIIHSALMIVLGLVVAFYALDIIAVAYISVGTTLGLIYNKHSSTSAWGVPILSVWGVIIVLFGAEAGNGATDTIHIFALLTGLTLGMVTFYADAVDSHTDSNSLAIRLGYDTTSGGDIILSSEKSKASLIIGIILQIILFTALLDVTELYWWLTFSMFVVSFSTPLVMEFIVIYRKRFRKMLVVYTLSSVAFLVMLAAPYAGMWNVTVISGVIVGWAIICMKFLYGGSLNYA